MIDETETTEEEFDRMWERGQAVDIVTWGRWGDVTIDCLERPRHD